MALGGFCHACDGIDVEMRLAVFGFLQPFAAMECGETEARVSARGNIEEVGE